MKQITVVLLGVAILMTAAPVTLAQEEPAAEVFGGRGCSPAGVWYGAKVDTSVGYITWLLKVTPDGSGGHTVTAEPGFAFPVPVMTNVVGDVLRLSRNRFEAFAIAIQEPTGTFPPADPPFILAVHADGEFIDCDTMEVHYDFQGRYMWGQVPFVDPPLAILPTGSEIYHRLPNPEWPPDWLTP